MRRAPLPALAAREFRGAEPVATLLNYVGSPLVPEMRAFVGGRKVVCHPPYWPRNPSGRAWRSAGCGCCATAVRYVSSGPTGALIVHAFEANKRLADRAVGLVPDDKLHVALDGNTNSIVVIMKHVAGNLTSRWTDFLAAD